MVADLGNDKESAYKVNSLKNKPLAVAADAVTVIEPGSGPRHLSFHPHKPYAYLIEELTGTVDVFHYDSGSGKLSRIQRISSVPANFSGEKGSADIHITPNGRFLYATNRGDANSIVIYAVNQLTGKLTLRGFQSTGGKHPRNFIIEPSGHFLLVANRDTDNIVEFRIDPNTGLLKPAGYEISIPNPVCLKLLRN
jgi:6-phosphogluconolactonase